MCVCKYVYMNVCMYVRMYMYVCMCVCACVYVCMYICVYVCYVMYVRMYEYVLCMCTSMYTDWPILVAARSKALDCGVSSAGIVVSDAECCVLSGRGLRVGLITRLEESYRVWCV
jgi:hypothetical protein